MSEPPVCYAFDPVPGALLVGFLFGLIVAGWVVDYLRKRRALGIAALLLVALTACERSPAAEADRLANATRGLYYATAAKAHASGPSSPLNNIRKDANEAVLQWEETKSHAGSRLERVAPHAAEAAARKLEARCRELARAWRLDQEVRCEP